uniref:DUF8196 domain-containing protein n=2 Tax=Candidatus Kentrum sp. SD TaxID=2126332 RepID=A0A450YMX7_9GAMM|nr:MAG: hypothetical protein BECKSD772F_GA0070984_11321 [Candidatus Kentron sp. SD]
MTDQELKELVASLAVFHKEARGEIRELRAAQRETDRQIKETDQQLKETNQRLKETDQQLKESIKEARLRSRETDKQIKELGKQIGGLGRKFGGLTEGMAYPSMKKLLRERFHMEFIVPRVEITRNGKNMELDVFGYSNGSLNRAVVVEVKSRLDQEGIEQMDRIMARFDEFLPEHSEKRRFGIVAAVDCSPEMKNQVRQRGFYLARIQDELFVLDSPESFRPRYFGKVSHAITP